MFLDRAALLADLREHAFRIGAPASRPPRVGAEVELIPVGVDTRRPLPVRSDDGPSSLPFLRRFGTRHGWTEEATSVGAPRFRVPGSGIISYEPGGQIEWSTPPFASASALVNALHEVILPLRAEAREEGIELLSVGVDPRTPLEEVPLQLHGERYLRMTEYLAGIGPAGPQMMRQTASVQVNLDWGEEPLLQWRVLNALAPYGVAVFANSPVYAGVPTGHVSFRAHLWRELDPARTGILPCGPDPVAEYLDFALGAPAIVRGPVDRFLPFGECIARGEATRAEWDLHLTTLFPEVRPKGFLEVRSLDAVAPEWYAAPLVFLCGIVGHAPSLHAAAELLGAPDSGLLRRAGERGVADPEIGRVANELWEIALRGAEGLGEEFLSARDQEVAREFAGRFTRVGRMPADEMAASAL